MNLHSIEHTRHVFAGQMQVGAGEQVLTALLGSCVGIGMIWRNGRRCALAHCLLPETDVAAPELNARYVSEAVPRMLRELGVRREQYDEVEVVVAGGASMLAALRGAEPIGRRNVQAARVLADAAGMEIGRAHV